MKTPKESSKKEEKTLNNLKNYLEEKHKIVEKQPKPPEMSRDEMKNFINNNIIPALTKIENQLNGYNFKSISSIPFERLATLRIIDDYTQFYFKVEINNSSRYISISFKLKYRPSAKAKLVKSDFYKREIITFNDIDTIDYKILLALFTQWFIQKDEILKDKIHR